MKVNNANLQVYQIHKPQATPLEPVNSGKHVNQLSRSRFADLLSESEKTFINTNFKGETSATESGKVIGRYLDVRA